MIRQVLLSLVLVSSMCACVGEQATSNADVYAATVGGDWKTVPGALADSHSGPAHTSLTGHRLQASSMLLSDDERSRMPLPVPYKLDVNDPCGTVVEKALPLNPALSTEPVSVNNIRYSESTSLLRVVVGVDGRPSFTRGEVDDPPRVYIDIDNARIGAELESRTFPVGSAMLETIRVGQHDPDTVRVVFDLTQWSDVRTFTFEEPDRLVVDILGDWRDVRFAAGRRGLPVWAAGGPIVECGIAELIEQPIARTDGRVGTPAQRNGDGDHTLIRSLGLKVQRVVIDPGHGGRDTGTIGPSGLTEKELVLDIAGRLKKQIETRLGATVVLTREGDSFVPLETRTALANKSDADLFLSIHANSSHAQSIRGFETYFLDLTTSREAMEVAARENASSQASISELQDIVRQIVLRDKLDESKEFATHIEQALGSQEQLGRNRGVKQAPFVVLIGANMPSALTEISFISNPEDEQLLRDNAHRQEIAEALFDGVRSYAATLSGFPSRRIESPASKNSSMATSGGTRQPVHRNLGN